MLDRSWYEKALENVVRQIARNHKLPVTSIVHTSTGMVLRAGTSDIGLMSRVKTDVEQFTDGALILVIVEGAS